MSQSGENIKTADALIKDSQDTYTKCENTFNTPPSLTMMGDTQNDDFFSLPTFKCTIL